MFSRENYSLFTWNFIHKNKRKRPYKLAIIYLWAICRASITMSVRRGSDRKLGLGLCLVAATEICRISYTNSVSRATWLDSLTIREIRSGYGSQPIMLARRLMERTIKVLQLRAVLRLATEP